MNVLVAGLGVSGTAAAAALAQRGEVVTVVDDNPERVRAASIPGVEVRLGTADLPPGTELVVTSPGWRPNAPLLEAAANAGVPVIGEVELAWRLRPAAGAPWLALTGTNGKTTAVRMLTCMLRAAGHKAIAVGNVGTPIVEAVQQAHDVLAVELSSFQLHWSSSLAPYAAAVLNVAPDHIDWHGSFDAYVAAKARIYEHAGHVIYNADDEWSVRLARGSGVGFTLGVPADGRLGVVDGRLVDRAYGDAELASLEDVRPFAPHNVANALAAAALARSFGVPADAVRQGLRDFVPDAHRIAHVARIGEVDWVDDSKATNPHAAGASLASFQTVVWVAGGQLKGADVADVVRDAAARLRGAVLIGVDRGRIRDALARHAPNVPVVEVAGTDTGVMDRAVAEAAQLAAPGDTVLLAPAGASFDLFASYGARGDAFAAAVRRHAARA